jgi:dTDP-4-amino-4,6-dideoxygalactose transaminase
VRRTLASGKFTANTEGEQEVRYLEEEWAQFVGTKYAVGVSNGTVALALALAALGVEPGDEVLVPAFSFVASALAPLHQLAVPVFVDIDPRTFNIDPRLIEAKVTPRTRAIMPVHFHGLPADMYEIRALARKYNLFVIEDAAQAHGASYRGEMTGSLGDIAGFSLHVQKNLPTCGEGGLITMNDPALYEKTMMLRQFGEVIKDHEQRAYVSQIMGWNYKLNSIQAAFTRSQFLRFRDYEAMRQRNVAAFLKSLAELPGVICPTTPRDRTHAWHILRFRFDPAAVGLDDVSPGRFRQALRRALRAEGVPISQYQLVPLPGHQTFQAQEGFGCGYPWKLPGVPPQRYIIEDYPNTLAVIEDSLTLQRRHLNPNAGALLNLYAKAFCKIWENLEHIARIARSLPYEVPWQRYVTASRSAAPSKT